MRLAFCRIPRARVVRSRCLGRVEAIMVLARFLPRDEQFFDQFEEAAANAAEVATLLAKVFSDGLDIGRDVRHLHDLEHRGDEITHRIFSALNSTFVTPLDREDIRALAHEMDDLVDDAEEAGKRLFLYGLAEPIEPARLLAGIVKEQTETIAKAVPLLADVGKHGDDIRRCVVEIHRLENEADDMLNQAQATLYEGVTDIPTLITRMRWGELCGLLEDATDRAEDVADVLETIYLKHG
jgi:predicted phosphate transport protein (TIGR00153 family)